MSTKATIKHHSESMEGGIGGFHLYSECLDEDNRYVYLELNGVPFEAVTADPISGRGSNSITVQLPVEWARKLGLIESCGEV
jgi:hypothetical protein